MDQRRFFGLTEHLEALSSRGDPLEGLDATVNFASFRGWLVEGLGYGDGAKGGRPPFDPVSMRTVRNFVCGRCLMISRPPAHEISVVPQLVV